MQNRNIFCINLFSVLVNVFTPRGQFVNIAFFMKQLNIEWILIKTLTILLKFVLHLNED